MPVDAVVHPASVSAQQVATEQRDKATKAPSAITDHTFITAGMDYYVAGRYAVFAGLNPTASNLVHHALEMTLKGALAKKDMDLMGLASHLIGKLAALDA